MSPPAPAGPWAAALEHARLQARYNRWMNEKVFAAAARLPEAAYRADRGAFFGSIHGTLNHLVLVDRFWLGWLQGPPERFASLDQELHADLARLAAERARLDGRIEAWAAGLTAETLAGETTFESLTMGTRNTIATWPCVIHLFNHQIHHRGQVTTLLTQAGCDVGATDLHKMPGLVKVGERLA